MATIIAISLIVEPLDALFFLACGFDQAEDEDAVTHMLGTFPILN